MKFYSWDSKNVSQSFVQRNHVFINGPNLVSFDYFPSCPITKKNMVQNLTTNGKCIQGVLKI